MSFDLIQFVKEQEPLFVGALTDQSLTWAKECQFAIQLFQRNQKLAETAIANPTSAQNAIINVAAVGISLNPASKLAYLVPRDGMVCLDISYMGLLHIAQSAGVIKWGQCKLVHASDDYETLGLDKAPAHKYNPFATPDARGAVIGGYCTVKTADGDYLTEEMSLAEIEEIRKVSKAGTSPKGPWVNFWSEMAGKTIVKEHINTGRVLTVWIMPSMCSTRAKAYTRSQLCPTPLKAKSSSRKKTQNRNLSTPSSHYVRT